MKPLILITNDDGVNSKGITELIKLAQPFGEVLVVAPNSARSAQSSALTVTHPLLFDEILNQNELRIISCTGTPADCVKLACSLQIPNVEREPDLILSGINHGSNASINVIYSGTIGGAIEGALYHKNSIGFSLCNHAPDADFTHTLPYFSKIIQEVIKKDLPKGICLNVNAPVEQIKGMKICRQAKGTWKNEFLAVPTPYGKDCYWLAGDFINDEPEADDTDEWALKNGYISIQPVQVDMTDHNAVKILKTQLEITNLNL